MSVFDINDVLESSKKVFSDTFTNLTGGSIPEDSMPSPVLRSTVRDEYTETQATGIKQAQKDKDDLIAKSDESIRNLGLGNISTTINQGISEDPTMSFHRVKELTHDLTKESSAEQGVIDFFGRSIASFRDATSLTPSEATELGRQYGVDLKYDKNVSRGEAMFTINKNLYKKDLEQQLAEFSNEASFDNMQNLSIAGSAISGGMGAVELAATIGLSFLLPEVGLAAIARLGRAGAISADAFNGIQLAYKTQKATQVAQRYQNAAELLSRTESVAAATSEQAAALSLFLKADKANKGLARAASILEKNKKIIESSNKITKFWYDLTNEAKMGSSLGNAGSAFAPKAALFASDFVGSSVPSMAIAGYNSAKNQNNTYTLKDAAIETLFAAALGVSIPAAIKALSLGTKGSIDVISGMVDNIKDMKAKATADRALRDTAGHSDILDKEADKALAQADGLAKSIKEPPAQIVRDAEFLAKQNMSDEEFMMNLLHVYKSILEGRIPRLGALPNKGMVLSHIDSGIIKSLDSLDIDRLSAIVTVAQTTSKLISATLTGETGLLGRLPVVATSKDEAFSLLKDIYAANMRSDVDAYIRASEKIDTMQAAGAELSTLLQKVRDQKFANIKGAAVGLTEQLDAEAELKNILGTLYYGDEYNAFTSRITAGRTEESLSGTPAKLDPEDLAKEKELDKLVSSFVSKKVLSDGQEVFNLKEKNVLNMISELNDATASNRDLLDSDDFLLKKYGSPDELLEALDSTTALSDTSMSTLFGMPRVKSDEVIARMNDVNYWATKVNDAKILMQQTLENSPEANTFYRLNTALSERSKRSRSSTYNDYFGSLSKQSEDIETLRGEGLNTFRENFITKFKTDETLQGALAKYQSKNAYLPGLKTWMLSSDSPLRKILTETVLAPLEEKGVFPRHHDIDVFINNFVSQLETNEVLRVNVKTSDIVSKLKGAVSDETESAAEQGAKRAVEQAKHISVITDLIDPFLLEIDKTLLNTQYNCIRTMGKMVDTFSTMVSSGYPPSEVLLSRFTFTPYNIKGSATNVENITNNANAYIQDLRRQLKLKSTGTTSTDKMLDEGIDLNYYMDNKENKEGIDRAMLVLKQYGSADAAKKAGIALNDNDAVIAQTILDQHATLINKLHEEGSMITSPGNNLHPAKLAKAEYIIPDSEVSDLSNSLADFEKRVIALENRSSNIQDGSFTTESTAKVGNRMLSGKAIVQLKAEHATSIMNALERLLDPNNITKQRLGLYAFKNFDLDKMFNSRGAYLYSLNRVRDELLEGRLLESMESDLYEFRRAVNSMEHIVTSIMGSPANPAKNKGSVSGWIRNLEVGAFDISAIQKGTYSKFVSDLNNKVEFKNLDAELQATKLFGYDTIKEQLEHDFNTMQRAYAVLKTVGPEPMDFTNNLIDIWNHYVNTTPEKFGTGDAVRKASMTRGAIRSLQNNVKLACGIDSVPASTGTRIWRLITDVAAAPLLTKAGFKSLTDYAYQHQWLITNGLADSANILEFGKTINSIKNVLGDPELRKVLFYTNALTQDGIARLLTNNDTVSVSKLVREAPAIEKAEIWSRNFTNFMINNVGLVDKVTNVNRSAGSLTLMRAVAAFADTPYEKLNTRLQNCLVRHGIDSDDWRLLSKYGVQEMGDYINKFNDEAIPMERGFKAFFADNIVDIPDSVIAKEMANRGYTNVTEKAINNFRNDLAEKAAILINSGANEMTTIPTVRTLSALTLGHDKNSGVGAALGILTKYQSFSLAATQIHFGRRLAQYVDPAAPSGVGILDVMRGAVGPRPIMDTTGLVLATAFAQFVIDEATDSLTGNRQGFVSEDGKFNARKVTDPIFAATGSFGPILDAIFGVFDTGGTRGGGISIPAAPAISSIMKDAKNTWRAASSESTKGNRTGAITASLIQNAARNVGLSTSPFTTMFWNQAIGSWLDEQARGAQAYNKYIRNRRRQGFEINDYQEHPLPFWEQTE